MCSRPATREQIPLGMDPEDGHHASHQGHIHGIWRVHTLVTPPCCLIRGGGLRGVYDERPGPHGGVLMDRSPVPMPRSLRLSAALLITSGVVACQGDNPAAPAAPAQPEFDLTLEGARIDLSIFDRSTLGDIGRLIGVETPLGGPLRGLGGPPTYRAPVAPGDPEPVNDNGTLYGIN